MKTNRNTKILATLGPASDSIDKIETLFLAGANLFRLNFSHGSHDGHAEVHAAIRQIEAKYHQPIGILADMQGPKLRIGTFKNTTVKIERGQTFSFHLGDIDGDEKGVSLKHPEIFSSVSSGDMLFLNDGKVRMLVKKVTKTRIDAEVQAGDELSNRKGVNLPDTILGMSALTPKDRKDLDFALELGVDWIALSFVQKPQDLIEARALVGDKAKLMAKLEKPSAITYLEEIIAEADGVMVARGDLGVEMPPEQVPGIQKQIIAKALAAGKPVVVATQMLESMISSPTPTRAEASDVANAVFEGADAVMLSAESAAGEYPKEAVTMMNRIIETTEASPFYRPAIDASAQSRESTRMDAISDAAARVVKTVNAKVIVTHTRTGNTAYRASRERPEVPIVCVMQSAETARALTLVWGVEPVITPYIPSIEEAVSEASKVVVRKGFAGQGDAYVMTAGVPFGRAGSTNTLRIVKIPDAES